MKAKHAISLLWVGAIAVLMTPLGCADGNACDPDMVRDRNYCVYPDEPTPGGMGGGMGGEPAGPPEPVEPSEIFGATCTAENEADVCGDDAPTCGIAPGQDEGVCTAVGCESEPDEVVCPIGWSCFSLADACLEDD